MRVQHNCSSQAELTKKRLDRAGKLTNGLASEGIRWAETAELLQNQSTLLVSVSFRGHVLHTKTACVL